MHGAQLRDVAIDLGEVQIDDEVSGGIIFGVACALHQVFVLFAFVLVELAADFGPEREVAIAQSSLDDASIGQCSLHGFLLWLGIDLKCPLRTCNRRAAGR